MHIYITEQRITGGDKAIFINRQQPLYLSRAQLTSMEVCITGVSLVAGT